MIKFTIPVNPATKKNNSQIIKVKGRPMIIPSKKYRQYEKDCKPFIPKHHINSPINIKAVYYRATKHTVDITNLHSALHDILVKYGCIEDDNYKIVVGTDGSRIYFDKENPRTEIEIVEIKEKQNV